MPTPSCRTPSCTCAARGPSTTGTDPMHFSFLCFIWICFAGSLVRNAFLYLHLRRQGAINHRRAFFGGDLPSPVTDSVVQDTVMYLRRQLAIGHCCTFIFALFSALSSFCCRQMSHQLEPCSCISPKSRSGFAAPADVRYCLVVDFRLAFFCTLHLSLQGVGCHHQQQRGVRAGCRDHHPVP